MTKTIDHSIFAKPSTLARAAFADFEKAEANPNVVINMGDWVCVDESYEDADGTEPSVSSVPAPLRCAVCFAGSIMIGAVGCEPYAYAHRGSDALIALGLSETESAQIHALDDLRTGDIESYVDRWKFAQEVDVTDLDWGGAEAAATEYGSTSVTRPAWKAQILETIAALEARGL
jgi:hypothetical protein